MLRIELTRLPRRGVQGHAHRRRWAPFVGLALALSLAAPVGAAGSGSVPGTVTVEQAVACLLVNGTYDFGSQPFATVNGTPDPHRSTTTASITSCGTRAQDVLVHGTTAAGDASLPAIWQLSAAVPVASCQTDVYGVAVSSASVANGSRVPVSLLDTQFASLLPSVGLDAAADIYMPCTGSTGTGETMTFSVIYTAVNDDAAPGPFEVEPNNDAATASVLTANANTVSSIYGAITPVGDRDTYRVSLPQGPVTIETFDSSGNATCAGLDTIVQLSDNNNVAIAQDDDSGLNACSLVSTFLPAAGNYYVVVTDFGNDSVIAGYRLQITTS